MAHNSNSLNAAVASTCKKVELWSFKDLPIPNPLSPHLCVNPTSASSHSSSASPCSSSSLPLYANDAIIQSFTFAPNTNVSSPASGFDATSPSSSNQDHRDLQVYSMDMDFPPDNESDDCIHDLNVFVNQLSFQNRHMPYIV